MNKQLFIIEGPDCSGKTTLAKLMAQQFDATYFHCTGNPMLYSGMFEFQRCVLENAKTNILDLRRSVVLDRHWPSEAVYGKTLRPDVMMTDNQLGILRKFARDLGVTYVFCFSDVATQRHAAMRDPSHPYTDEQHAMICVAYETLYHDMANKQRITGEVVIPYHLETASGKMAEYLADVRRMS